MDDGKKHLGFRTSSQQPYKQYQDPDHEHRSRVVTHQQHQAVPSLQIATASNSSSNQLISNSNSLRTSIDLDTTHDQQGPLATTALLSAETRTMAPSMAELLIKLSSSSLNRQSTTPNGFSQVNYQSEQHVAPSSDLASLTSSGSPIHLSSEPSRRDLAGFVHRLSNPSASEFAASDMPSSPAHPDLSFVVERRHSSLVSTSSLPDPLPSRLVVDDSEMDTSSYPEFLLSSAFPGNSLCKRESLSFRVPTYRRARDTHVEKANYVERKIRVRRHKRRHHGDHGHEPRSRRGSNVTVASSGFLDLSALSRSKTAKSPMSIPAP